MQPKKRPFALVAFVLILAGATAVLWISAGGARESSRPLATFVGREACAECHQRENEVWSGSHHDLAMQVADEQSVLGNFDNTAFTNNGLTSTFFRRDGVFHVRTEGPDGELHDYPIAYTFGVTPLQQYLIEFPGGRYQVLSIAWDTRPEVQGGQRWFHLYPGERIPPDDILHWTGLNQNWNYMCAECHSTNLKKNYDLEQDRYATTWSELNVSCEACHGPGSNHVGWASEIEASGRTSYDSTEGLTVRLGGANDGVWVFEEGADIARRTTDPSNAQLDTCARCHSRRAVLFDDYVHGRPLLDTHRPQLLLEELYHADGQILDEVYVYGSFLQSSMYHQGVTCSDCHDPHSLTIYSNGNALCSRCHLPDTYETPSHHFHTQESRGAACVECHMPARTYMVVDPRRDHSFRVPRPDLSVVLGTPNACTECHSNRSAAWAAQAVARWYGAERRAERHYGEALSAGRSRIPSANADLVRLASDPMQPNIARATAVSLLGGFTTQMSLETIRLALNDQDPLVRFAALGALEILDTGARLGVAFRLLSDSIRAVRIEAVRVLSPVPSGMMTATQRPAFDAAATEYIESQLANADRPEAHHNLGLFYANRRRFTEAAAEYQAALRLDSSFVPAYVNLAELRRAEDREADGERVLRTALEVVPADGAISHALGLLLVRQQRLDEALEALERAAALAPGNARFSYVFGIALNSTGNTERAVSVLERANDRHPYDRDILFALATLNRDRGAVAAAIRYARRLVELWPENSDAQRLLVELDTGAIGAGRTF